MKPTLILQVQRMGDLVLTFPLMARLRMLEPERPLWVMAEPKFYRQLMPLTPSGVTYMPPAMARSICTRRVARVINLSHRDVAVRLAGRVELENPETSRIGLYRTPEGALRTGGVWALYRAALTHNNRHNRMHWADLNALDALPSEALNLPIWPRPNPIRGSGRIGLFVGASEREKRPNAVFWGELAKALAKRGVKPVFLGGPGDRSLAENAARVAGFPDGSNLAGNFTIAELVTFFKTLDLVVTPDTGPMHVSAWTGILTLNLSMGPVNPWETAPASPGHYVLRPTISCTGCWKCPHPVPPCRAAFVPQRVAGLIMALLHNAPLDKLELPRLTLYRTARGGNLFLLQAVRPLPAPLPRTILGRFWKQWFLSALGGAPCNFPSARELLLNKTSFQPVLAREAARLGTALALECRQRKTSQLHRQDFWQHSPPLIRPLSGFTQMLLQNGDYSPDALRDALGLLSRFAEDLQDSPAAAPLSFLSL